MIRSDWARMDRRISRSSTSPRLRAIPNLQVYRPADTLETESAGSWRSSRADGPSVLVLTRQNVPQIRQGFDEANRCAHGAYELIAAPSPSPSRALAMRRRSTCRCSPSGSEVAVAVAARELLAARGLSARVDFRCRALSTSSLHRRRERAAVIGRAKVNVAVEAGIRQGWDAIIGSDGAFVGMAGFGASAPYKDLYRHFGITPERAADAALATLQGR